MKQFSTLVFLVILQLASYAQHPCSYVAGMANGDVHRIGTTGQNIDVVYNRIYWRLNPDTINSATTEPIIKGTVTVYFKTKQANVNSLSFDLIKSSYNNANLQVSYHGSAATASFPSSGNQNVLNISLPSTIVTTGTLDSITINYGGKAIPAAGEAYGARKGGTHGTSSYYWTLAESFEDRNFYPCKADTEDKIDSMLTTISTPPIFTGVTNGRQISDVTLGTNNREITYKLTYPIASYLVAFSVGRFNKYVRTPVNVNGTSVPITYYTRSSLTTSNLNSVDVCKSQMSIFSQYFGDYPFKNDGYGLMEFGFGGGMEHQTISSMNGNINQFGGINLNAHELAHQWFGDKVTFKSWNDLWIAEGFAKYLEAFNAQKDANTSTSYSSNMNTIKTTALTVPNNSIYLPDVSSSDAIWAGSGNSDAVYEKGAMVVSMLRAIGGDTKFYQACQNLLNHPNHAYKSANTTDVKNIFSSTYGINLTEFFNDWIYGKGFPKYAVTWGKFGNRVNIQLNQTGQTSGATVSHFSTPVKIRLSNSTKDTTVVIFDDNGTASAVGARATTNTVSFFLSFSPTTLTVDPENEIAIDGTPSVTLLQSLPLENISLTGEHKNAKNILAIKANGGDAVSEIVLERSLDGTSFIKLVTLTSLGAVPNNINYAFTDNNPYLPATYYRVKFLKFDGSVEYSTTLKLVTGQLEKIKLLANPVTNTLRFNLNTTVNNATNISISSIEGKLALKQSISTNNSLHQVDISHLQTGNYVMLVHNKQGQQVAVATFLKK